MTRTIVFLRIYKQNKTTTMLLYILLLWHFKIIFKTVFVNNVFSCIILTWKIKVNYFLKLLSKNVKCVTYTVIIWLINVRTFLGDTKMLEGRDIPFKQLGCSTFEDMLRKINGLTVFLQQGKTVVKVTPTEETAHISRMVRLQKPAKKKPKRVRHFFLSRAWKTIPKFLLMFVCCFSAPSSLQ